MRGERSSRSRNLYGIRGPTLKEVAAPTLKGVRENAVRMLNRMGPVNRETNTTSTDFKTTK
jgi:hypothetical protein